MKKLEFRPHHFLCTIGFEGKGYSPDFVRAYQAIADRLREDPNGDEVLIHVAHATDAICEACPNRRGTLCETEPKIQTLDQAHARILGLSPGQALTWGEAKRRLAERMTQAAFDQACAPCGWKALGVCEKALNALKSRHAQGKSSKE